MRQKVGVALIAISIVYFAIGVLLFIFFGMLNKIMFETTLVDSCKMGDSQETIRLYYTATILDASWWATYQAQPRGSTLHIVGSRTDPEITQIECRQDSVVVTFSDHSEELTRKEFLQTITYYRRGVRSIEAQEHPSLIDTIGDWLSPFGCFIPPILILIIGLILFHYKKPIKH